jgi:sulfite dehydrogenase
MTHPANLPRRHLLAGSLAALGAVGLATWTQSVRGQPAPEPAARPLPVQARWKKPEAFIVHSGNSLETRRAAFGTSVVTPANQLFVRNNLPSPESSILDKPDTWSVAIEGVKTPRSLTLAELQPLGLETVTTVLQCAANGRAFFPGKSAGSPLMVGAAGCVVWSGVPLRKVVASLGGLAAGAAYLTGTGGEKVPEGVDPLTVMVERSVPIAALDDAILAWEMNGEPLQLAHGGPLRLIVPGYLGENNVKYVRRVAFTAVPSQARSMTHNYRLAPPGAKQGPEHPAVLELSVKSWINSPLPEEGTFFAGVVQVQGVAFGGMRGVRGVEVSVDGGKTWQAAQFIGPDLGRFAWRQFVLPVRLAPGDHMLFSRATDVAGNVQAEYRVDNAAGYNNTSWRDHGVSVTIT